MCIIAIKPIGKDLMSKEVIQTMCSNNPHGNGFSYAENGKVVIKKGYMDFESFYVALNEIPNIKDKNVVLHMRITTHGSTSRGNCHPFPLSNRVSHLKATHIKTDVAIIHNGIISSIEEDKKNDLSDTMTYIKNVLYPRYRGNNSFMDNESIREEIKKEINSKMVIMKSDGEYYLIGDFIREGDYIYSNYSFVNYDYSFNDDDYIEEVLQLEYDDFIMIDGVRVYGSDADLYLTEDGVYMQGSSLDDFTKVSNYAFDYRGAIIHFEDRYLQEMGMTFY